MATTAERIATVTIRQTRPFPILALFSSRLGKMYRNWSTYPRLNQFDANQDVHQMNIKPYASPSDIQRLNWNHIQLLQNMISNKWRAFFFHFILFCGWGGGGGLLYLYLYAHYTYCDASSHPIQMTQYTLLLIWRHHTHYPYWIGIPITNLRRSNDCLGFMIPMRRCLLSE